MAKYTTTSLIVELLKFPKDTPIETELAFIFDFDDKCYQSQNEMSEKEFTDYCRDNAKRLAIFEGSWESDHISDLNNIMPTYVKGWFKTKITLDKKEYEKLLRGDKIC